MDVSAQTFLETAGRKAPGIRLLKKAMVYSPILLLLATMTVLPLTILFLTSVLPEGAHPLEINELTLQHYADVFGSPTTYRLLGNTFLFAGLSLVSAMTIALTMAWLVERSDMPLKSYAYIAILLPMAMPGFITAIGWTYLLNPSNGIINVFLRDLLGLDTGYGPFNIYSLGGMVMVAGLSLTPTMFIMLSSLMRNVDPSLEDSAYASGANSAAVMGRIVIPLLRPGLLSVFIYFAVTAIEMLEIPLLLGVNAKFNVLSVAVFSKTTGGDTALPSYGLSSTYAIIGLIIGLALLLLYFRLMRQADKFAIITGKGYRSKQYKLGKLKYAAYGFFALFVLLKLVFPLALLLWSSLLPYFQNPSIEALTSLTFANYAKLFTMDRFLEAVINTVVMVAVTSLGCMALAAVVSWMVVRGRGAMARAIDVLAFLPHLLPGLVIALALLLTSIDTPLYGTLSVLIIGNVIRYLPFGVRMMTSVMYQVAAELEDAAYASGASRVVTFRRIVLPLVLPSFVNGIVWVGSHTMKDMTLPLFLVSTSNIVIGGLLWETWSRGAGEVTAAIAVLLVAVLLCVITPIQMLLSRRMKTATQPLPQVRVGG
jgi:iron(III) transport system permease protein